MDAQRPTLVVVDDDPAILRLVSGIAVGEGFEVATTNSAAEALVQLLDQPVDLVLLDLGMPGVTGLDILCSIRGVSSRCKVALMTGCGTIETAVEAVKLGASDYLTKPLDVGRLRQLLRDVRREAELRRAVLVLERDVAQLLEFCGMIGRGPAMRDVFDRVRRLAPHASTVLVTGEIGTGKELVARALHQLGPRSNRRFVAVNCPAVVETQFESELFGHVRGACAGATAHKPGLVEMADGGTLFLDEVGELPLAVQARLLRVLEDGEVQRMGSAQSRKVDMRLIAATRHDLRAELAAGRFRPDLYHRLNIADVSLPPLRDRRGEIPYLTAAFVRGFSLRFGKPLVGVSPGAERMLADAAWEGNVRQLRNVLERACLLAHGEYVTEADLAGIMREQRISTVSSRFGPLPTPADAPARLVKVEREHIIRTLQQVRGNKAVAARLLGISRREFYRQLERHGLHRPVPAGSRVPGSAHYDVEQV
jgi:DNA-binding NtrC family response regulator